MSVEDATSFARLLRQRRVAAGLTQEALAERSGLGARSIQGLERAETRPRRETLRQLINALGLAPEQAAEFELAARPAPRHRRGVPLTAGVTRGGAGLDASARHNLPVQLTSFVGRERAVIDLRDRLRATHLLTLTGTGGCGKTRLALEVAANDVDAYVDGVWLVELAGVVEPALVDQSVATVAAVREVAGQPLLATVLAALHSRQLLLVLDNCEHLIEACARLTDAILRACPNVRILATSREPLGIDGEVSWRVPSLTVAAATGPDDPLTGEAARLFVDRAVAAAPSFSWTEQNAEAVARVCRRLDGIPLAIELAARRVTALSVEQIAVRLDQRFRLLTGGSRAGLPRHQTLAAIVDWSYNLLSLPERVLFDRLAVFAGGFTLDGAETVAGDIDERAGSCPPSATSLATPDVVDLLTHLVDKSLVVADLEAAGTERYRLLETLRQYAYERLEARGEREEIRRRHAAYYLDCGVEAGPHVLGPEQVTWLDRLDRDHDNLHAALRWAIERKNADLGLRLVASLSWFWYLRGHYGEARALRSAVLALPTRPDLATLRAELLQGAGMLAIHQGDYPAARAFLDEGLAIARQVSNPRLLAFTLITVGWVTRVQDDYVTARPALEEGLTVARDAGDDFHAAMASHHLGLLDLEADRDVDVAWSRNEESLAYFRQIGNRRMAGVVLVAMSRVARLATDVARARTLIIEAIHAYGEVGDVGQIPQTLHVLASLDADAGQLTSAVRLAAAAAKLANFLGAAAWPVTLRERDAWLVPARATLGDADFARAWAEGQSMTREQAVAYALDRSTLP
jgi:predicted ATPase/transcriptional regulator with XRE-family HTH domain